jgi:hypothetical protein
MRALGSCDGLNDWHVSGMSERYDIDLVSKSIHPSCCLIASTLSGYLKLHDAVT